MVKSKGERKDGWQACSPHRSSPWRGCGLFRFKGQSRPCDHVDMWKRAFQPTHYAEHFPIHGLLCIFAFGVLTDNSKISDPSSSLSHMQPTHTPTPPWDLWTACNPIHTTYKDPYPCSIPLKVSFFILWICVFPVYVCVRILDSLELELQLWAASSHLSSSRLSNSVTVSSLFLVSSFELTCTYSYCLTHIAT